jgi:hypothetical protein
MFGRTKKVHGQEEILGEINFLDGGFMYSELSRKGFSEQ